MNRKSPATAAFFAHTEALAKTDPQFSRFYGLTLAATEEEDLQALTPEVFETILRHSYTRLGARAPHGHLIHIWSPEDDLPQQVQIVDIFVDNMPFLVDSILAAIRAHGGSVRLMAHPILPIERGTRPWTILGPDEQSESYESFLQIHIDPITDEIALAELYEELDGVLTEVRKAVKGWRPMLERLRSLVADFRQKAPRVPPPVLAEALHFLAWIADHNFTFLGMREYRLEEKDGQTLMRPVDGSGLGLLDDPEYLFLRHGSDYVEMTKEHLDFLKRKEPLLVTKANARARVHRRAHMDYVGAKLYDEEGMLTGELRIVGLFTSTSMAVPHTEVPLIRRKIAEVMRRSGLDPASHAGKALMTALSNYPRDEMFQISEDQLFEFASIIATLPDRPRVRVLPRIDPFDNYVSVLVFVPRESYTAERRARIGEYLAERYDGRISSYTPHFPEGDLVRVHFVIGRIEGRTPQPERAELEDAVRELTLDFGDRLLGATASPQSVLSYRDAFSPGYQARHDVETTLDDIAVLQTLQTPGQLAVRLGLSTDEDALSLKFYRKGDPIPLSSRVPLLENFGFTVIDERTDAILPNDGQPRMLHDMTIRAAEAQELEIDQVRPLLEEAISAIWRDEAESDAYNRLTISAALAWDDVAMLRALGHYLRQAGTSFSQAYLARTLAAYPEAAATLVRLFHARLDPDFEGDRDQDIAQCRAAISEILSGVGVIDDDRIIRHFRDLVEAALRTNFYQRDEEGARRPAMAIKFAAQDLKLLPAPRPFREIFVYAPRVEGVHLRFGAIARGGLRWSDRPEDFRTEILGLAKAQQVKNAIIVPVGAKGGFVPRQMPANPDRDTFLAEGTACYKIFVGSLLDITDNLEGETVVPPPRTVRQDGDDPYLVVAADKGTASFSDTANAISVKRGYWLGDAFASGGSAGYDHKKMGITARGGWEAVKRHFREMNRDIQNEPFTAIGVGDMSGDVFGNGMLLSRQTRLLAAFDHRDIFVDPDPDPAKSYAERQRLFEMGRSNWQDYDPQAISEGGGIFSRKTKSIPLSAQIRALLGIDAQALSPNELIRAILAAKADLLWFGGIGTYVRSKHETNAEVGDRANDAVRLIADELNAKVIGEGANLGLTQKARIAFALAGGRVNTDAIDNSAGVNSSDLEVNIKIALGTLVRDDKMSIEQRNALLAEMTGEVAELCLRNNYLQTLTLSLTDKRGNADLPDLMALMQNLEARGLDRGVEFLPDDTSLLDRAQAGQSLTRPELAVLLAYAKNTLYADLLASDIPDDPYLATELFRYFPDTLTARHPAAIEEHRLRREVIATVLSNAMINRGGPAYVHMMTAATAAGPADVAFAYAAARDAFDNTALNAAIDALDTKMDGPTQLALYAEVKALLVNQTLWFLRNVSFADGLGKVVERYRQGVAEVRDQLNQLMPPYVAKSVAEQAEGFVRGGTPEPVARRIAELSALTLASDIVLTADKAGETTLETAKAYFNVLETFHLGRITEQGGRIALSDRYDRMALDRAIANVMRAQRDLTRDVLAAGSGDIGQRLAAWHDARAAEIDRITSMVSDLTEGELTVSRLSVAAGLLSDLVRA